MRESNFLWVGWFVWLVEIMDFEFLGVGEGGKMGLEGCGVV